MPISPGQPFTNMQPYVAVTFVSPVGGAGVFPGNSAVGNAVGFIYGFAGSFAPAGSRFVNGPLIDIADDDVTFSLIGTIYGGDGTTNYGTPDLQGRAIVGDGTSTGMGSFPIGGASGEAEISLTLPEIPPGTLPAGGGGQAFSTVQPVLPLRRLICTLSYFPNPGSGPATFMGQVATFQGNSIPGGWMEAAGQTLQISTNQSLFFLLGTTYGGDGVNTFKLPDLRGRVSVGADATHPLGTSFGQETVALDLANLPPPTGTVQPVNNVQPSLALNYIIATSGQFPTFGFDADQRAIGQIAEFAGNFAPGGWAFCDGSVIQIATNTALFAVLGTKYGGDGISTFALPDLRGRTLIGAGTGGGLTYSVGDTGGSDTVMLGLANLPAPCFAAGTRIRTARGEVAVEDLTEADHATVLSGAGLRPIRWIGHRRIGLAGHPRPWDVQPVRVATGAFAPGMPHRDLWLSPDHAVFIPGTGDAAAMLVPVRYLINGRTIVQEPADSVTYYHIELASQTGEPVHDVLLAEGMAAESYLDTGNRNAFANADAPVSLHADFTPGIATATPCIRLVTGGNELLPLRAALLARAQLTGHARTNDPGLNLLADGALVPPVRTGETYRFALPHDVRALRLWSRRTVPAHLHAESSDTRSLGVAVCAIHLDGHPVALDSPHLSDGWHAPEAGWRWTTGLASLESGGARVLEVTVAPMAAYWYGAPEPATIQAA